MSNIERVHILYSGNVQGVGFRFTAQRIAWNMGVSGFVRNLSDGDVEIVSEGERARLESFIEALNSSMGEFVRDSRVRWEPARGDLDIFQIKF